MDQMRSHCRYTGGDNLRVGESGDSIPGQVKARAQTCEGVHKILWIHGRASSKEHCDGHQAEDAGGGGFAPVLHGFGQRGFKGAARPLTLDAFHVGYIALAQNGLTTVATVITQWGKVLCIWLLWCPRRSFSGWNVPDKYMETIAITAKMDLPKGQISI